LHNGQVGPRVRAYQLSLNFAAISEAQVNAPARANDVMVGEQEPVRRKQDTGARAFSPARAGPQINYSRTNSFGHVDDNS
jgi:hypothetical protein